MMGFKTFHSLADTIAGIEVAHMISKNQFTNDNRSPFQVFAELAAELPPEIRTILLRSNFATRLHQRPETWLPTCRFVKISKNRCLLNECHPDVTGLHPDISVTLRCPDFNNTHCRYC